MPEDTSLAVVSGASSGIGQATARTLAVRGWHVLGGVRREADGAGLAADGIEPVLLDVTDPAHIARLAERVERDPEGRRLGALVNNAGTAINAPVEAIPLAEWRRQFDVNFFGHVAMTQALLPSLLKARGRIVNVSSIGGRVAGPLFGAYAASKFALEAMSDSLRREVGRLGVRVIVVEPGAIATPIWAKGEATASGLVDSMSEEQRRRYADVIAAGLKQAESLARSGIAPSVVAETIAKALESPKPRPRYLVGRDAKVTAAVARWLPTDQFDRLVARSLGLPATEARGAASG
ncbi:SDR family NAD(P)-dependent oxidoreductase [Sinomonas sp. G460-2]|uniref:SDR family NAD(P)-dependent oxidoreductase n=1 Tax=Sinomonas sp. G460-2 TaxID=3393464 RepID=UPI0039EE2E2E